MNDDNNDDINFLNLLYKFTTNPNNDINKSLDSVYNILLNNNKHVTFNKNVYGKIKKYKSINKVKLKGFNFNTTIKHKNKLKIKSNNKRSHKNKSNNKCLHKSKSKSKSNNKYVRSLVLNKYINNNTNIKMSKKKSKKK